MKEMNIPAISVNTMIRHLGNLYVTFINGGTPLPAIPSVFLWGASGVGKSDGIRQIAEKIEKETGKTVHVTDVRLLLFSPIDLRGVPVADQTHTFTEWLRPKIFALDPSEEVVNLLFLDELSAAPQSVQAAAYQITLDRTVGEHRLPDNTIIIGAGNRTTDRSVAYRMPNALANRMMHFRIEVDFGSWKDWAEREMIHPLVLGYLSRMHEKLYVEPENKDDIAYPTPRTWAFVSKLLTANGIDPSKPVPEGMQYLISGCLGIGEATEFAGWCNIYKDLPSVEGIFAGTETKRPKKHDALYTLIRMMIAFTKTCGEELTRRELENVCRYVEPFPADFRTQFFLSLIRENPELKLTLMKIPSFTAWMKSNRQLVSF